MKIFASSLFLLFNVSVLLSQDLTKELDSLLNLYVGTGQLHGCVAYVQQSNNVAYFKSYGFKNIEKNEKMENDVIFRIASMSKVITAAGALKLYEDGYFLLDDPVKKYIPEFGKLKVMENIGTDSASVVDLQRDVTIRDLFRHTAGFGYAYTPSKNNDTIDNLYVSVDLSTSNQTSKDFISKMCEIPLKYQPGSKWRYSYSIDLLGFLIETVTNKTSHEYLKESMFDPLDMSSTGFFVSKENVTRFSANYQYKDGKLILIDDPETSEYLNMPTIYSGGGGLKDNVGGIVTSAGDFANFCSMLLNYGEFNGKQVLRKQTVELMISNQIDNISDRGFNVSGYGFGVGVAKEQHNGKTKTINWAGGPYNTSFFIDYDKELIAIFLTQNSPWIHLNIMGKFANVVNSNTK